MRISNLDLIKVVPLKTFKINEGNVMHALKSSDKEFNGFEEAYFSIIKKDKIKAWKRHLKMTMNLIVPIGSVMFNFYDQECERYTIIEIGEANYSRITVPPKIWFGFIGKSSKDSLILNISNVLHDEEEMEREPINFLTFKGA
tara:strand:- start:234 stop:662 length:429 start_codon:yes stop_codon:yes gene_type:complete